MLTQVLVYAMDHFLVLLHAEIDRIDTLSDATYIIKPDRLRTENQRFSVS